MRWCEHGKTKTYCKDCKGNSICEHGKIKYRCMECGGTAICEHSKIKYKCKECNAKAFCEGFVNTVNKRLIVKTAMV